MGQTTVSQTATTSPTTTAAATATPPPPPPPPPPPSPPPLPPPSAAASAASAGAHAIRSSQIAVSCMAAGFGGHQTRLVGVVSGPGVFPGGRSRLSRPGRPLTGKWSRSSRQAGRRHITACRNGRSAADCRNRRDGSGQASWRHAIRQRSPAIANAASTSWLRMTQCFREVVRLMFRVKREDIKCFWKEGTSERIFTTGIIRLFASIRGEFFLADRPTQ